MKTKKNIRNLISIIVLIMTVTVQLNAQYAINFIDNSTYTTTCGKVDSSQWVVRNDSCLLYTPILYPNNGADDSIKIRYRIRINQSGNLDSTDINYIYIQKNSGQYNLLKMFRGTSNTSVFSYVDSMKIAKTDDFRFIIAMHNNSKTSKWFIKNGDISINDVVISENMPIELLSFNAKSNKNNVMLTWSTATETNNDYFTIEKSQDGIAFSELVNISGVGNSTSIREYSYNDENPYAITYYRLKQTDFDGKYSYSEIISVNSNINNIYNTRYSVIDGTLKIMLNSDVSGTASFNVYNLTGAIVFSYVINVENNHEIDIPVKLPVRAIYIVSVKVNDMQPVTSKFFVN
ncbi:MAG: hypothetical protein PHD97_00895 [Bacteroidales bacterium]|nr:hypothetical protein [Bacteroidales bacterium]